jgi:putative hydrolase of the HAD superfamily
VKNIVFDCGQVLVHFEPAYMVGRYVSDREDAALLAEVVFDRLYWDCLDAGTLTSEAMLAAVKERLPERLWDVAETIYYNWIYNIPEMEGMRELIVYLKETYGVSVFLLSNISLYFAEHADEIPILKLIDKCIFSSTCGKMKPDPEIYTYLCSHFEIDPRETVFIDDREDNIASARSVGITGYVFDGNVASLRLYLDGIFKKTV